MVQLFWFDHIVFETYIYIDIDIDIDIADIDVGPIIRFWHVTSDRFWFMK